LITTKASGQLADASRFAGASRVRFTHVDPVAVLGGGVS
jgi:hypothetical protein